VAAYYWYYSGMTSIQPIDTGLGLCCMKLFKLVLLIIGHQNKQMICSTGVFEYQENRRIGHVHFAQVSFSRRWYKAAFDGCSAAHSRRLINSYLSYRARVLSHIQLPVCVCITLQSPEQPVTSHCQRLSCPSTTIQRGLGCITHCCMPLKSSPHLSWFLSGPTV
jgi:hypothetical protein